MEMPRYSFRLKKEDTQLQKRIEDGIEDGIKKNPKHKSSDVIRELLYKGFEAEQNLQSYSPTLNAGASSSEVEELKVLVMELLNEVKELKQQAKISLPAESTTQEDISNKQTEQTTKATTTTQPESPFELSEAEIQAGLIAGGMMDGW